MRKYFIGLIFLLSMIASDLMADNVFFAPYPSSFNVDLTDTYTYSGVDDNASYTEGMAPGYSEQTMVALLGIHNETRSDKEYTITFTVGDLTNTNETWEYKSASEPYLRRPFRFDIVENNSYTLGLISWVERRKIAEIGYGMTSYDDATVDITAKIAAEDELWFDIVLELPEVDAGNALAKSDYYAEISITVTDSDGKIYGPWPYYISGYIGEGSPAEVDYAMMNVIPTANANAINIDQLKQGDGVHIADYFYESMAFMPGGDSDIYGDKSMNYDSQKNNPFYIFASSSSDPNDDNADWFEMRMVGLENEDNLSEEYSFPFVITIKSKDTTISGTSTDTNSGVSFYGKTPTDVSNMLKCKKVPGTTNHHSSNGVNQSIYFYDEGEIYFDVPSEGDPNYGEGFDLEKLYAGVYTARIYLHVVSAS